MKPMIGLIRIRAKAGMTSPAAPRMTRASLKPEVRKSASIRALEQVTGPVSPIRRWWARASGPRIRRVRFARVDGHSPALRHDVMASAEKDADLDLIVVGGGPAGIMAGLLFARAGCRVLVLEKHADFFRDFRGDTVHPSTMEILDQLGMLERFLARPHNKVERAQLRVAGRDWTIGDLSHLHTPAPFIAMMPQWDFLDFLHDEAKVYPGFHLEMEASVESFIEQQGRVVGVRLTGGQELHA